MATMKEAWARDAHDEAEWTQCKEPLAPSGGRWLGAAVRAVDAILHWVFAEPDTDGGDYADAATFFADTFHYGANPNMPASLADYNGWVQH